MGFRRLRTKIIVSFCLLMAVGGIVTTAVAAYNLSKSLTSAAEQNGRAEGRNLARRLVLPLSSGDGAAIDRTINEAITTHRDLAYALIVDASGGIHFASRNHSRPPHVPPQDGPATLYLPAGHVLNVPLPVADGTLGTVHVGISLSVIDEATGAVVRNVLITTLLAVAVGIIGIVFMASYITRPVHRLIGATKQMAEGNLGVTAPVQGADELAELARTFNEMAAEIRDRMADSERVRVYYEHLLDHIPSGVFVCDRDGKIEYANEVIRSSTSAATGRACAEAFGGAPLCGDCPAAAVLETGSVLHRAHTSPAGRSYELTFVPFPGEGGRRSVVVVTRDVTEMRVLAERLRRAERLAVAGEVAAGVVHTINNPLDGVRRALDLAGRSPGDPARIASMLSLATEGTERIAAVTRTLLDLARAEEAAPPSRVLVGQLIEDTVQLVRLKAESSGVKIELQLDPSAPAIWADPHGVREVVVNLLLNAIDASAAKTGGRIVVRTRVMGESSVEVTVGDNGVGIAPEILDRVFEPFFTTKEIGRGTGLGLSVARRIVEAHGGEISVESTPGQGATFRVQLPAEPRRERKEVA